MSTSAHREIQMLVALKERLGLKSDTALAKLLCVDRKLLSEVMTGRRRLGVKGQINLLDRTIYRKSRDFMAVLLPKRVGEAVDRFANASVQVSVTDDAEFLAIYKEAMQFATDQKIANRLGISASAISMVKNRKSNLGALVRLQMFIDLCKGKDKDELMKMREYLSSRDALARGLGEWSASQQSAK